MAKKQVPVETPDPEELEAEHHVEEIMNPDFTESEQFEPAESAERINTAASDLPPLKIPGMPEDAAEDQASSESTAEPEQAEPTIDADADEDIDLSTSAEVESEATDKAVDDIVHSDADAALPESKEEPVVSKKSVWAKLKSKWHGWWTNPWSRYATLVGVLALIITFFAVEPIRAAVLNTFGVRTSMLVTVYDGATNLPLQNAVVQVGDASSKTNDSGKAKVTGIRLGDQEIEISKIAFATYTQDQNFGMRIIEIDDVTLKPVGVQLSYVFTDYLSGKPVQDVALTSGESTAKTDKDGKAIITLEANASADTKIEAVKDGYRTDSLSVPKDLAAITEHKLIPSLHAIYVSKVSGKYDVYKTYIDGQDKAVLLAGTGREGQSMATLPSPDGKKVAVASTRDDQRNSDGYLLTALNIVDVTTGDMTTIDHVEQAQLLGWRGDMLIYQQIVSGTSAGNPSRMKIIAYDTKNGERFQLANGNSFGYSTQLIGSTLYYVSHTSSSSEKTVFAQVDIDGSSKKTLAKASFWSLMRTEYNLMKLQTPSTWYEYTIGQSAPTKTTPSDTYTTRYYVDSPDGKTSAWVDARDTNGVLLAHNVEDSIATDAEITTQRSLQAPLYWLNNRTVVYRVANSNEVADYAVNIDGGDPVKIAEVSLTNIR